MADFRTGEVVEVVGHGKGEVVRCERRMIGDVVTVMLSETGKEIVVRSKRVARAR